MTKNITHANEETALVNPSVAGMFLVAVKTHDSSGASLVPARQKSLLLHPSRSPRIR